VGPAHWCGSATRYASPRQGSAKGGEFWKALTQRKSRAAYDRLMYSVTTGTQQIYHFPEADPKNSLRMGGDHCKGTVIVTLRALFSCQVWTSSHRYLVREGFLLRFIGRCIGFSSGAVYKRSSIRTPRMELFALRDAGHRTCNIPSHDRPGLETSRKLSSHNFVH
jgi:hypothetical protein